MTEGHTERLEAALDGKYRIESKLGEGGMATVYLAQDVKHERKVALKILKPELAAVIGAERFLSEIKTTANLQHPHILALFDSGEASGYLYYVMPYIQGETLRDKLDREKQLGVEESVRIACDVADALDYAHRQGVIHRDIKPANILLHDGRPVVADFGIALAVSAAGGGRMTETGLSLGTPHYMSPEQASADRDLSARSDVYSLGCVLYEMLGGQPPHTGPSAQSILVHILTKDVTPLTELRHTVPPHVAATVAKAIEKLPADRFDTAKQFMEALGDEGFSYRVSPRKAAGRGAATGSVGPMRPWNRLTTVVAALAAVLGTLAAWGWLRPEPSQLVSRQVLSTAGWAGADVPLGRYAVIAPDGSSMILPVGDRLAYKMRNSTEITPIAGTEDGRDVVYSPDGEWIAYAVGSDLFKRPLIGGSAVTLAEDVQPTQRVGLAWMDDGTILYEQQGTGTGGGERIVQISEDGGDARAVFDPGGETFIWVHGLPGARGALVLSQTNDLELHVVDLRDLSSERILEQVTRAWYAPTGHIVYVRTDGAVFAVPFDLSTLTVTGGDIPLFSGVRVTSNIADMRLAADGTLLYVEGSVTNLGQLRQLVVIDLDGSEEALVLPPRDIASVSWSPDGRSVVFSSGTAGDRQIFTYDVVLGTPPRQLTFEGDNGDPVFSPDGTRVAFSSLREGTDRGDLFVKNLNDDSPERSIITLQAFQYVTQWPSDSLIVFERTGSGNSDVWSLDLSDPENPTAQAYLPLEANARYLVISPDGTLAAYRSRESGQNEVYIRSFPEAGAPTRVSQDGGGVPFWSPDGSTLYYAVGSGLPFMAAHIERDPVPVVVSTEVLAAISPAGATPFPGSGLHPDGDRFIVARDVGTADVAGGPAVPARVILVENFFEELRERLGGN